MRHAGYTGTFLISSDYSGYEQGSLLMRILHRVALNPSDEQRRALTEHGIQYEDMGHGMIVCLVDEQHSTWPALASFVAKWRAIDLVFPRFSKKELSAAPCLLMHSTWHYGYPMPDDDDGYKHMTYSDSEYCSKCGIGLKQQAPFRMRSEPKWGKKHILQLNWIMGEFFVTPQAWESVFKPFGIECLPVLHHKTDQVLKSVRQLSINAWTLPVGTPDGYVAMCCAVCKRVSLGLESPGRFPHVELPENVHIARTPEYFGVGIPWHEVIVSAALYKAIVANRLRGATFEVVAAPGQPRR